MSVCAIGDPPLQKGIFEKKP